MLGQAPKFLLRWRYDYPNGPRMGMWSNPGGKGNAAWSQNKEGLIRASVEGKNLKTKEIVTLAQCDGHDFRVFQWIAAAKVPGLMKGTVRPMTQLIGMKILTGDTEIQILDTGHVQEVPLKEGEKNLNFATYG